MDRSCVNISNKFLDTTEELCCCFGDLVENILECVEKHELWYSILMKALNSF